MPNPPRITTWIEPCAPFLGRVGRLTGVVLGITLSTATGLNCIGVGCPPVITPGIVITVSNATTAMAVATAVVTVDGSDATVTPSGCTAQNCRYDSLVGEGVHTVLVQAAGFQPQQMQVTVERQDACTVRTVQLDIQLQPIQ